MNQLIILLGNDGDGVRGHTDTAASGPVFPDSGRCRAQRLPRRMPRTCVAFRTEAPSPELLGRVLEGLKRL